MINNKRTRVKSEKQYDPRLAGEILHDYLENSNEPLAVAYREHTTESEEQGWNIRRLSHHYYLYVSFESQHHHIHC